MSKKIQLTKYEKDIRIDLYCYAWKKYKNKITMTSLANIFKTSTPNFFQIVKREREEVKEK